MILLLFIMIALIVILIYFIHSYKNLIALPDKIRYTDHKRISLAGKGSHVKGGSSLKKRRSIVLYWSFSYTVIILLSLISMVLVYTATQKVVKQEITQANNSIMENAAQGLDRDLLMVRSILYELQEDYTLTSLNNVNGNFRYLPPYQIYQANGRLQNALLPLPFIKEILVFYPQTESSIYTLTDAHAAIFCPRG